MSSEPAAIRKHSVLIAGHQTSVSLENAFWDAFCRIARDKGLSINDLVAQVDGGRDGNLSSAIRLYVLANRPAPSTDP
ncbi:MAG: ribbon-helix-helix domain-containing protein [Rhodospirillaceae bacterium]|jgi:predicted DNA-binding ribbon-helix-helix protein|nr:ribbon-helix-helix domain-containing protein [Rhodospirillaceae bacterium]MBT5245201.1 ribbon-helix-helix domain-containing protein [Rhodospirillaceae bacterium]MBT5561927.1 ribbon-helix-helix domain-containing protein [Rhodospirillaceae bacterium]MBT6241955.1 ribbon-helix-helix domain-containing protein [Rhodospirillaceae bacterium]MBT7138591.1 ribbon-helix-helix domain-containing protein [Rhodospirillaceae bacterium]